MTEDPTENQSANQQDKIEQAIETLQEAEQAATATQQQAAAVAAVVVTPADAVHGFEAELQQMEAQGLAYAQVLLWRVTTASTVSLRLLEITTIKVELLRDLLVLGKDGFTVKYALTPEDLFGRLYGGLPTVLGISYGDISNG